MIIPLGSLLNSSRSSAFLLCSKRPRRAASGGVLGAVAAEASEWGLEMVSPPLKRANSLPVSPACLPARHPGIESAVPSFEGHVKV